MQGRRSLLVCLRVFSLELPRDAVHFLPRLFDADAALTPGKRGKPTRPALGCLIAKNRRSSRDPQLSFRAFLNNHYFGLTVFIGIVVEYLLK